MRNGSAHLALLRWGLIPSWAKDEAIGSKMINARAETLAEKPSFRGLLRSKRCLIVADGFYEWKQENGSKTPMYIRLKMENLSLSPVCGISGKIPMANRYAVARLSPPNRMTWLRLFIIACQLFFCRMLMNSGSIPIFMMNMRCRTGSRLTHQRK